MVVGEVPRRGAAAGDSPPPLNICSSLLTVSSIALASETSRANSTVDLKLIIRHCTWKLICNYMYSTCHVNAHCTMITVHTGIHVQYIACHACNYNVYVKSRVASPRLVDETVC